jgi:diphosphomevalonate decarboxylase
MTSNTTSKKAQQPTWVARAPSNIALIKYMGKIEGSGNRPTNSSLSFTLGHLNSVVSLEFDSRLTSDRWEPLVELSGERFEALELSQKGATRFLGHLQLLKDHFGFNGSFVVRSANDFPSDCGLASSASSFAALTMAGVQALAELTGASLPTAAHASELSRRGSGSSCRSFFSPWSIWTADGASAVPELESHGELLHQVVVVNDDVKAVSSSEAHKRVTSSALFSGRPERAEERVAALIKALRENNWNEAFEIAWAEFWDMHALFETSRPSFGYMTAGSLEVLNFVRNEIWQKHKTGPLVTMDAGPNVHLLYRQSDAGLAAEVSARFADLFRVISSQSVSARTQAKF